MLKYVIRDFLSVLRYLPCGIVAGVAAAVILKIRNAGRRQKGKETLPVTAAVCFYMYAAVLLAITFFSREAGSGQGLDLELFSSFGINARNDAYAVENVLLFIPYGFACLWYYEHKRRRMGRDRFLNSVMDLGICTALGLCSSFLIEGLQFLTQRGVFQIDDILTNTLGSVIGGLLFLPVRRYIRSFQQRGRRFWRSSRPMQGENRF